MLYELLKAPITCQIEIISGCNNKCIHCYNHWMHGDKPEVMKLTMAQAERIAQQLIENQLFQVTITGGEPFLNRPVLFKLIELLIEANISCSVNSNLISFTKADGSALYSRGIRGILTSICSSDKETHNSIVQNPNGFEKTMRGIDHALTAGLSVSASMVVTKLNAEDVLKTAKFLKEKGVSQFYATKASPPLNSTNFEQYMISDKQLIKVMDDLNFIRDNIGLEVGILECYPLCFFKSPEKYPFVSDRRCSAGITTCTIGSDGGVRPCSHHDTVYGNIFGQDFKTCWEAMTENRNGSKLPAKCLECDFLNFCSGGCRVDAKYCFGKYTDLDPYAKPDELDQIELTPTEIKLISDQVILEINPTLKIREEKIGVLCADRSNMGKPVLLTTDTYELITFYKNKIFTIEDIMKTYDLEKDLSIQLASLLLRDRVFIKNG